MQKVLLVVDMVNDFTCEDGALYVPEARRIAPLLAREINRARKEGVPVIFLCDSHSPADPEFANWPPHAVKGTPGAALDPVMGRSKGDHIVKKRTYSAFYRTRLNGLLKKLGADTLRITGCVTNICVYYAAMEAAVRGYALEIPAGLVAGFDRKSHESALHEMENVLKARVER